MLVGKTPETWANQEVTSKNGEKEPSRRRAAFAATGTVLPQSKTAEQNEMSGDHVGVWQGYGAGCTRKKRCGAFVTASVKTMGPPAPTFVRTFSHNVRFVLASMT